MTVSQEQLQSLLLPRFENEDTIYRKCKPIHARLAEDSEVISTIIDDEEETQNIAQAGDYIVKNLTKSEETYVVEKEKFAKLYRFSKKVDDSWGEYIPLGKIKALQVTPELLSLLDQTSPFLILAQWGEEQRVESNDFLATPLDRQREVYRIERSAFAETYRPIGNL